MQVAYYPSPGVSVHEHSSVGVQRVLQMIKAQGLPPRVHLQKPRPIF